MSREKKFNTKYSPEYKIAVIIDMREYGLSYGETVPIYSRGLYEYFRTDVQGKDVVGKMETLDETDNRLILAPDCVCCDEGVHISEMSEETIKNCRNAYSITAADE